MKLSNMLRETFECVKINGILRNLTNDEMKIYKKVKDEGKVFKSDLSEFDANVATSMVTKGLLRRVKSKKDDGKHGRLYFIARGRKGHLSTKQLDEVAPPDKKIESWIKKNKKRFKDRYGKGYEKYLYGKAWNNYNGKLRESMHDDSDIIINVDDSFLDRKEYFEKCKEIYQYMKEYITGADENKEKTKAYTKIIEKLWEENCFMDTADSPYYAFDLDNGDIYEEYFEKLVDYIRQEAHDTGSYNVYYDSEYDGESTWDDIYNSDDEDIVDRYASQYDWKEFADNALDDVNAIIEAIELLNQNGIIPTWNGSEEESENEEYLKTIQSFTNEAYQTLKNNFIGVYECTDLIRKINDDDYEPNSREINKIYNLCNNINVNYRDLNSFIPEETLNTIKLNLDSLERIWESLVSTSRDAAQDSGDFDRYFDQEVNEDETWERVDEDTLIDWLKMINYSYDSEIWEYILKIYKLFEAMINAYVEKFESPKEKSTGEEFNESVLL